MLRDLKLKEKDIQHIHEEIYGYECSLSEAKDYLARYLLIKNFNHAYSIYSFLKSNVAKKEIELV